MGLFSANKECILISKTFAHSMNETNIKIGSILESQPEEINELLNICIELKETRKNIDQKLNKAEIESLNRICENIKLLEENYLALFNSIFEISEFHNNATSLAIESYRKLST